MPVFSSIVAILFFLNCQKQDFTKHAEKGQPFLVIRFSITVLQ